MWEISASRWFYYKNFSVQFFHQISARIFVNFYTDLRLEIAAIKPHISRKKVYFDNTTLSDGSVNVGSYETTERAAAVIIGTAVGLSWSCGRPTSHKWLVSSLRQDFNICQVDIFYLQVYLDGRLTLISEDCTVLEGFVFKRIRYLFDRNGSGFWRSWFPITESWHHRSIA